MITNLHASVFEIYPSGTINLCDTCTTCTFNAGGTIMDIIDKASTFEADYILNQIYNNNEIYTSKY
ncbi:MAG: hypothetical protein HW421_2484 [Ignavibacteria bacterium]|nr:hypothetical protein [Ignavibacteria bacterium]